MIELEVEDIFVEMIGVLRVDEQINAKRDDRLWLLRRDIILVWTGEADNSRAETKTYHYSCVCMDR